MAATKTTVVIVNWNGEAFLEPLIRSILDEAPAQTIIVDNHSTDGSLQILEKFSQLHVLANAENRGFGVAANQGFASASTEFVLILNADVRAVPGAITGLEKFLEKHEDAAAVAPRLQFADGALQTSCRKFPTPMSLFMYLSFLDRIFPTGYRLRAKDHQSTRIVEQPMGAVLMIRKSVLDQVGGFDERFFLYMEDVDLCERIVKAGGKIYYYPEAQFFHAAGGSSNQDWFRSQSQFVRSVLLYFRKKGEGLFSIRSALFFAFMIRSFFYLLTARINKALACLELAGRSFQPL